ncbi:glycosyltransferase family 9 protein [Elusimicrobiota bacterium]
MKVAPRKILIVARGGIGNVVMFTATLRAIKKRLPSVQLFMMVLSNGSQTILALNPDVTEVIAYKDRIKQQGGLWRFILALRRHRFDTAIVMNPGGLRSALWALISGAGTRIGFNIPLMRGLGRILYTKSLEPDEELHDVDQNLGLLPAIGLPLPGHGDLRIVLPEAATQAASERLSLLGFDSDEQVIGIHPGSTYSQPWKRWPASYFRDLIHLMTKSSRSLVLLFGSEHENEVSDTIIESVGRHTSIAKVIDADLLVASAMIGMCNVFVGNDSALVHVAAAKGVLTFCLGGPTDTQRTGPYGPNAHVIRSEFDCPCRYNVNRIRFRCRFNAFPKCMTELKPAHVFRAISSRGFGHPLSKP